MDWQHHILTDPDRIAALIAETRAIAVIGIKPETQSDRPAFYVPRYLAGAGFEIVPVPVYEFGVARILGRAVHRKLADVPDEIDMVLMFRRSEDVARHVDEILARRPRSVWLQQGIRDDVSAERFARAGITTVQDRCLMVEHRRLRIPGRSGSPTAAALR